MLARKKLAAIARKKKAIELAKKPIIRVPLKPKAKALIKQINAKGPLKPLQQKYIHRDSRKEISRPEGMPSKDITPKHFPTMYTGEHLVGIGVAHKSCLVPIFSSQEAIDLARMRR